MKVFVQDPGMYLSELSVSLTSYFDNDRPASFDSTCRSFVGFESFFFATAAEKQRFDADVVKHCGIITDPVTKERIHPHARSPKTVYNGRQYYFAADSTLSTFAMMPDMYWLPNFSMIPQADTTAKL